MSSVSEFNRRNIEEFRANHGRIGGRFDSAPMLLLHTIGARSGQERVNPMMYLPDGANYIVFASAAGSDQHPAWYWNLRANPEVVIEVGDKYIDVRAVELTGEQRDAMYAEQVALYPSFADYEAHTSRTIPVVKLLPRARTTPHDNPDPDRGCPA